MGDEGEKEEEEVEREEKPKMRKGIKVVRGGEDGGAGQDSGEEELGVVKVKKEPKEWGFEGDDEI